MLEKWQVQGSQARQQDQQRQHQPQLQHQQQHDTVNADAQPQLPVRRRTRASQGGHPLQAPALPTNGLPTKVRAQVEAAVLAALAARIRPLLALVAAERAALEARASEVDTREYDIGARERWLALREAQLGAVGGGGAACNVGAARPESPAATVIEGMLGSMVDAVEVDEEDDCEDDGGDLYDDDSGLGGGGGYTYNNGSSRSSSSSSSRRAAAPPREIAARAQQRHLVAAIARRSATDSGLLWGSKLSGAGRAVAGGDGSRGGRMTSSGRVGTAGRLAVASSGRFGSGRHTSSSGYAYSPLSSRRAAPPGPGQVRGGRVSGGGGGEAGSGSGSRLGWRRSAVLHQSASLQDYRPVPGAAYVMVRSLSEREPWRSYDYGSSGGGNSNNSSYHHQQKPHGTLVTRKGVTKPSLRKRGAWR